MVATPGERAKPWYDSYSSEGIFYAFIKHRPNNYNSDCTYAAVEDLVLVVSAEGGSVSHLPITFSLHPKTKECRTPTHLKEQDNPDTNASLY